MKDIILSLYDLTGNMTKPWVDAGYTAVLVDMQHPTGVTQEGSVIKVGADIRNGWIPPRDMLDRIAATGNGQVPAVVIGALLSLCETDR